MNAQPLLLGLAPILARSDGHTDTSPNGRAARANFAFGEQEAG